MYVTIRVQFNGRQLICLISIYDNDNDSKYFDIRYQEVHDSIDNLIRLILISDDNTT